MNTNMKHEIEIHSEQIHNGHPIGIECGDQKMQNKMSLNSNSH
jgi:hypothetical protein